MKVQKGNNPWSLCEAAIEGKTVYHSYRNQLIPHFFLICKIDYQSTGTVISYFQSNQDYEVCWLGRRNLEYSTNYSLFDWATRSTR